MSGNHQLRPELSVPSGAEEPSAHPLCTSLGAADSRHITSSSDATATTFMTACHAIATTLAEQFEVLGQTLSLLRDKATIPSDGPPLRPRDDALGAEWLDRYRTLSEQFHEREVLQPLFRALIGIVDRCREQEALFQRQLDRFVAKEPGNKIALKALRERRALRAADRMDIENILATFGVDPFQNPGSNFDPACQSPMRRVPCANGATPGHIAQRLNVGYRRGERIIRPEYVTVFVGEQKKGD